MSMSKAVIVLVHYKNGNKFFSNECKVTFNLTIDGQPPILIEGHETTHFLPATFILHVPNPDIPNDNNLLVPVKNECRSQSEKKYHISATLRDSNTNNLLYTTITRPRTFIPAVGTAPYTAGNGALNDRKRRFTALISTLFHRNPSVRITTAVSGRFSRVYSRFRPFTRRSVGPG
jgi:hypothetical protein